MASDPVIMLVRDPEIRDAKDMNSVWFEWTDEKDETASSEAGYPVFDSVVMANVAGPGMQRSGSTRIVMRKKPDGTISDYTAAARTANGTPNALAIYKPYLDAFLKGDAGELAGTPLTELAILDHGVRASLKAMNIHSIEALAAMSETAAPALMGFRKFKTAAQAFLDQRAGQQPLLKLTEQLEAEKAKNALLESNFNDLLARVKELEADKPAKGKKAA